MKKVIVWKKAIVFLMILMMGCAGPQIKYSFDEYKVKEEENIIYPFDMAIIPFRDMRPMFEREELRGVLGYKIRDKGYTAAYKDYKGREVSYGVSSMIAEHFNHVKLFKKAEVLDPGSDLSISECLSLAREKDYRLVLTGDINHFYSEIERGFVDDLSMSPAPPVMLIPMIVTLPIVFLKKRLKKAWVELGNLELIDVTTGKTLWEGKSEAKMEKKTRGSTKDLYENVNETLFIAINKLIEEIKMLRPAINDL